MLYTARFQGQIANSNLNLADPAILEQIKEGKLPPPGQTRTR